MLRRDPALALIFAFLAASVTGLPTRLAAAPSTIPGFRVEQFAGSGTLSFATGLAFDADGVLHVSESNLFTGVGRVLRVEDRDGDGTAETITTFADGFGLVTGIAFHRSGSAQPVARRGAAQQGPPFTPLERIRRGQFRGQRLELVVSHFRQGIPGGGAITIVRDGNGDGVAEQRRDIVTGLPSDGLNGNQQPAIGLDGRIYFAQGARTNAGIPSGGGPADTPLNATILRVNADGTGLEVVATGLRNSFDLAFTPSGELFATENGPDPSGPGPVAGTPDELNAIVLGEDYGWPLHFGFPPEGTGSIGPIATFSESTSTDGLALSTSDTYCGFDGDFFVAQFGSFTDPSIGRRIAHVDFRGPRAITVREFASGFGRPLDVAVGPDDSLYVADFSNAFFSGGSATIWRIVPLDTDADGTPDICEP